jgi:hypothetical protein
MIKLTKVLGIFSILIMSWGAKAQDERYFRQIFSGELTKKEEQLDNKKYSYVLHSPYYALDLNRDGAPEQVVFVKRDSEDWVEILSATNTKIYSFKFDNLGFDSELFKIEMKTLGPHTTILLLYYYEGISRYIDFQGTSRVYAMTLDYNDLKTLSTFKGPSFFDEVKTFKGHYHKRNYDVYLEDLNKDSLKELIIKYRASNTVFMYKGEGKWQTFRDDN